MGNRAALGSSLSIPPKPSKMPVPLSRCGTAPAGLSHHSASELLDLAAESDLRLNDELRKRSLVMGESTVCDPGCASPAIGAAECTYEEMQGSSGTAAEEGAGYEREGQEREGPGGLEGNPWQCGTAVLLHRGPDPQCQPALLMEPRCPPYEPPTLWQEEDISESYDVQDQVLGTGEFGVVRPCVQRRTGKHFACKTVDKAKLSGGRMECLRSEISAMSMLPQHPNVVELLAVFEEPSSVHLVMELCGGGDLFEHISRHGAFSEADSAWIFRKAATAVSFCHDNGVAHLDIKPENVLVTFPDEKHPRSSSGLGVEIKLADFGQAVALQEGQALLGLAGSCFYMAPEVIMGTPYHLAADIWSLGVLLYVTLAGYLPFWAETPEELYTLVCHAEINFYSHPWPSISGDAKDLLSQMLSRDPMERPTARQLLTHPWLLGHQSSTPPRKLMGTRHRLSSSSGSPKSARRRSEGTPSDHTLSTYTSPEGLPDQPEDDPITIQIPAKTGLRLFAVMEKQSSGSRSKNSPDGPTRTPSPRSPLECSFSPRSSPPQSGTLEEEELDPSRSTRQSEFHTDCCPRGTPCRDDGPCSAEGVHSRLTPAKSQCRREKSPDCPPSRLGRQDQPTLPAVKRRGCQRASARRAVSFLS